MTGHKTSTAGISRIFVRFRLAPKEQLFCITWQFDRIFLAQSDLDISRIIAILHNKVRQKNIRNLNIQFKFLPVCLL